MSLFHEGPISMPRAVAPATFELPRGARPFQSVPLRMLADRAVLELMLENGVVDEYQTDYDQDGTIDEVVWDTDEDGYADAYADASTGWAVLTVSPW